jgi:MFS transporter, DHA1 family, inner membrane transport protein
MQRVHHPVTRSPPLSTATAPAFPFAKLLVISAAIFMSITAEVLPTGLLPEISADLGVTEAQVGLLITVFAGTVVLSTVPLAVITRHLSRKWLMVGMLGGIALANLVCAIAPDYGVLVAARVLGGVCHGLFWAVTGPYASLLVAPGQLARAVSVTNAGGTLAFIAGVPVGTAIGQLLGWRTAFLVLGVVVLVAAVIVALRLPPVEHRVPLTTGEIAIPVRRDRSIPAVIAVCVLVILVATGQNAFYTYIAPWIERISGFDAAAISPLLFVYGVAGAIGLVVAGLLGDRHPDLTPKLLVGGMIAGVVLMALTPAVPALTVVALVIWSASFGGFPAMVHAGVIRVASPRVRDVASASLSTSFNVAIGVGSLLGGGVLEWWGVGSLPWVMTVFLLAALAFQLARTGRSAPRPTGSAT